MQETSNDRNKKQKKENVNEKVQQKSERRFNSQSKKQEQTNKSRKLQKKHRAQEAEVTKSESILSVVIPLYNEEESLPELSLQLESVLKRTVGDRYEVIFVDDGSTDNSFEVIKQIRNRNNKFKCIRFRRNYGKSAALSAGFAEANGVIVVTMDADLQDDPEEIPNLIKKLKEGYDLVSGWKKHRKDPLTKTIPSKFFNFITSLITGLKLHDFNCGLKIYKRDVVKNINVYGELHRYIPALAKWEGFKVTEIPVVHHPRRYGKTKFGFSRFIKGFLDLITLVFTTRFFKRPMHFFGTIGSLLALTGFAIDLYLVIEWFLGQTFLSNRPLALFGITLIIVGVQLFSFGLIGEMITKNSLEKYNYSIREKL